MKKLFVISVILMGIGIFGFIFGSMIQTNGIELPVIANIGIHLFLIGGDICYSWYRMVPTNSTKFILND